MVELELKGFTKSIDLSKFGLDSFQKPIIFYLVNRNDSKSFFIAYVIINFLKNEMVYLFSYSEENTKLIDKQSDNEKYLMTKCPHCTISINSDEDFLTFNEDENFFVYVNYKKMIMKVYTLDDLVKDGDITFKKISHTFFKDDMDHNHFLLSAVDSSDILHIFRISLNLNEIEEVHTLPNNPIPPHALKKHKDLLFLSVDFGSASFELQKTGKIVSLDFLRRIYFKHSLQIQNMMDIATNGQDDTGKKLAMSREKAFLFNLMREKYSVKCLPGRILLLNMLTKEKTYYYTTGSSPAHFEIDAANHFVYTSSHNFLAVKDGVIYLEPAVIDKFKMTGDKLELIGSFTYPKGYRYTSHKIFYYENKPYICTFGQPNRLIFIDAEKMELLFYHDIEEDELTNIDDVRLYISSRINEFEITAVEVSQDGKNIIFVGSQYVYFYNFQRREVYGRIDFRDFDLSADGVYLNVYKMRTVHMNYMD